MIINLLLRWVLVSGLFLVAAQVLPTIKVRGWRAAVGAALTLGVANLLLGYPILWIAKLLLFLPNILTLGLLGFLISIVVNVILLKLVDKEVGDAFDIEGLPTLVGLSLAISAVSSLV